MVTMNQSTQRDENTQEVQNCKTHEEFDERATWNLVGDASAVRAWALKREEGRATREFSKRSTITENDTAYTVAADVSPRAHQKALLRCPINGRRQFSVRFQVIYVVF